MRRNSQDGPSRGPGPGPRDGRTVGFQRTVQCSAARHCNPIQEQGRRAVAKTVIMAVSIGGVRGSVRGVWSSRCRRSGTWGGTSGLGSRWRSAAGCTRSRSCASMPACSEARPNGGGRGGRRRQQWIAAGEGPGAGMQHAATHHTINNKGCPYTTSCHSYNKLLTAAQPM